MAKRVKQSEKKDGSLEVVLGTRTAFHKDLSDEWIYRGVTHGHADKTGEMAAIIDSIGPQEPAIGISRKVLTKNS